jgi:hypothetical protein
MDKILEFLKKFRSFFAYAFGYITGGRIQRLKDSERRLKTEVERRDKVYEAIKKLKNDQYHRLSEYYRMREDRRNEPEKVLDL